MSANGVWLRNSIKFRFDTENDPRGVRHIWIDPPWTLNHGNSVVTSSDDYTNELFREWQRHFDPLNRTTFVGWEGRDDGTTFRFSDNYTIFVPAGYDGRDDTNWFDSWYAKDWTDRPA